MSTPIKKVLFPKYYEPQYYDPRSFVKPQIPQSKLENLKPQSNPKVRNWIHEKSNHSKENQELLTDLTTKVNCISFPCFVNGLKTCYQSVRDQIDCSARTAVCIVPQKSNEWVAQVAMNCFKDLARFPCFNIDPIHSPNLFDSMRVSLTRKQYDELPIQFILFDDASYSGDQLVRHLESIVETLRYKAAKGTKVFVIVPYMTQVASSRLAAIDIGDKISLIIGKSDCIPTLKELFVKKDHQKLRTIFPDLPEEDNGVTLTCFQHKIPNSRSFFEPVAELLQGIKIPYKPEDSKEEDL